MSEETEIILKLGALFVILILPLSFIQPTRKPLKKHLKDVLMVMLYTSGVFLFTAFLSHIEVLHPTVDFITSKMFLIPFISLITAILILLELSIRMNKINRHNYKKEIAMFLVLSTVIISFNLMVYVVLTTDMVPVMT